MSEVACGHTKTIPDFDVEAARSLSAHEIKRRWPRFFGACPDCGIQIIGYASPEHYIMGDW